MSDKLLKDGLRTSAKIGGVSVFAELLFVRLLLATCPLGRCPWSPDWILVHALSNRPSTRLATITAALEELRACQLVTRYTHDDDAYLTIPRHGQRFKHAVRSPWPAPREGPPDAEGQTFMVIGESPPPPVVRGKKPKAVCESPALHTHFSSVSDSESSATNPRSTRATARPGSDQRPAAECIPELVARYPRHDIPAQIAKARRYVRKQRGDDAEVTAGWFILHWMPGAAERPEQEAGSKEQGGARPSPSSLLPSPGSEAAAWSAAQEQRLAALIAGPQPEHGTLDHAIWLEGRKSA